MSDHTDDGDEDGDPRVPPMTLCQTYRAGHQTHWIMAKRHRGEVKPGVVLGFEEDLVVVRCADGTTRRWWHHQPLRLRAAVEAFGSDVELIPGLPALVCSGYWFSCREGAPDDTSSCLMALPRTDKALHEVLAGEPWRAQPAVVLRTDGTALTLRRTYDDATGTVGLSLEVPDVAPDSVSRGSGVFGTWAAGPDGGATLSVRFPATGALARHRTALTARAGVDLVRTALGDLAAGAPLVLVPGGRLRPADTALPVLQDSLLWDLPGWSLSHEVNGTTAQWETLASIVITPGVDVHLGTGLRFEATLATPAQAGTTPAQPPSYDCTFGRWTRAGTGLTHTTFLSDHLLAVVDDFPATAALLSTVVRGIRMQVEDRMYST
jgi:hypothetical protein